MTRTTELIYWINERESMRLRKATGKRVGGYGWSADFHMGTVRYCNVHREDDKVTQWLAQHWRPKFHAPWEIVLARMVNYIPTLELILKEVLHTHTPHSALTLESVADIMVDERSKGNKIWTAAYTISTCGQAVDKIDYVMGVVRASQDIQTTDLVTLAQSHRLLQGIKGLGSFLAAQVVADLKNTAGHPLEQAPDWATWAAHGPGSLAGLRAYFGKAVTPATFSGYLSLCWGDVRSSVPEMHMQDFQNCMCEFSKYIRVKEGGHARNRYIATA